MSPVGAIVVPFPPKTGTNLLHPRPPPQSLNGSDDARVYGEQFAVTGSLLDARRAGEDCPLPGQFLAVSHAFGPEAVAAFAAHVGDNNSIHIDEEFDRSIG